MTDIITITQAQTMSSLQIAELTGKRHDAILRDIRNLLEQGVAAHNFVETSYTDKSNRQSPCYQLTKTGCLILASGYNAVLREKIINRWIELEMANTPKLPQTFAEALRLAAEQAEENERLMIENGVLRKDNTAKDATIVEQDRTISLMKPKAAYYDAILNNPHTLNTTSIASDYGMTPQKFNKLLHSLGIQKKVGGVWIPFAKYISQGYTKISTDPNPNSKHGGTYTYSKWTQKGRLFLYETLKKKGVLPLIER